MSESSLSIAFVELRQIIGDFIGITRNTATWDTSQSNMVEEIIKQGIDQFYHPPAMLDPRGTGKMIYYEWSFLRPSTTIVTVAEDYDQDLPDDFGGMQGTFVYDPADYHCDIHLIGVNELNRKRVVYQGSGYPEYAAIEWKAGTGTTGQRAQVLWHPTPTAAYTLHYQYSVLSNALTTSLPYPLGGAAHRQTIIESCEAAAEIIKFDEIGIHNQLFKDHLAKSIMLDKQNISAEYFVQRPDKSEYEFNRIHMVNYLGA